MSEQKQTVKVMAAREYFSSKGHNMEYFIPTPEDAQQYAEYYHAEKMKQVGNDAEQAAEEYAERTVDKDFDVVIREPMKRQCSNDFLSGWQAKPSDAVEFEGWLWDNGYRQTNLKGIYSNSIGHYNVSELYSQFQKDKDK